MTTMMPASAVRPPHILTLVIATGTGALSMNVFLPSLPGMTRHFDVAYSQMQLTVSLYMVAVAFLQLVVGPASDRFGRRPVMLACFVLFNLGTLGSIFAPNFEVLLLFRLLQAFSAAGVVLSRAAVRDTVGADQAASRIGYITMGMALVPMLAPMLGGILDEQFGWRATFVFTLLCGMISLLVVFLDLRETNSARSSNMLSQLAAYPDLFRSRRFWGYTAVATLNSGTFFAFLGGGPYVASEMMGMSPSSYGLYFGLLSLGYIFGNFAAARLSSRLGINVMMLAGNLIAVVGLLIGFLLFGLGHATPLVLFGTASFVGVGNGVTLPNAIAGMVSVRPHLAGTASGLGGSIQMGGGALIAMITGVLLSPESGPYPLLWMMFLSAAGALSAALYVRWINNHAEPVH